MGPLEWMALIVAVLAIVKLLVIATKPGKWMSVVKAVYAYPGLTTVIALVLALGSFWYLQQSMSAVQIFAVIFFVMMLMLASMASFAEEVLDLAKEIYRQPNILMRAWLPTLVWVVLLAWLLWSMFG